MNLKDKLKGLPTIYYVNLDHRTDRRDYMESQFDYWKISNFHRISATKYLSTEDYKWQHLVLDTEELIYGSAAVANSITHIEMIKNWLETTSEQYLIIMEDDYDLSLIEYWNFDWNYLMNHIPENWDCILLGFENEKIIPFFLTPLLYETGFGPCLLSRDYAKKLVNLHYIDNKFKLNIRCNDLRCQHIYGSVDCFMITDGLTYQIPLITNNPDMGSDYDSSGTARGWFKECRDLYYDWWQNEHHKYALEDFFTYGKRNDLAMTRKVNYKKESGQKIFYS